MDKSELGVSDGRRERLTREIKEAVLRMRGVSGEVERAGNAIACGRALLELREVVGRGSWNRWMVERCGLNRMTANRYIRLARGAHLIARAMTLREAYIAAGVIRCVGQGGRAAGVC
jgi:hypothetical protein